MSSEIVTAPLDVRKWGTPGGGDRSVSGNASRSKDAGCWLALVLDVPVRYSVSRQVASIEKKMGLTVESTKREDGERCYHVA